MRGSDSTSGSLFSYVDIEQAHPTKHPLRTIREIRERGLASLDGEFSRLYETTAGNRWRPNAFCGPRCCRHSTRSRSERQLMEHLDYNLVSLVRRLGVDDARGTTDVRPEPRPVAATADVAAKSEAVLRHLR